MENETSNNPQTANGIKSDVICSLPIDIEKYPYYGICGKCGNFRHKLDKHCLCQDCYSFGVRRIGGEIPDEIFKFVKPRF